MKSPKHALFDTDKLRKIAGDKAFERGQGYADRGLITLLSLNGHEILAAAFGSDDYTVWLKGAGSSILGQCTCPAYDDAGFCKHLVATALVANTAVRQGENPPDKIGEIAARIAGLKKQHLEKLLLEMATSDWRVLRSLSFSLGLEWYDDMD